MCERLSLPFPETFRLQFQLTREGGAAPESFTTRKLGEWRLHHCPDLTDEDGAVVGYCPGPAVDGAGRRLRSQYKPPARA